MLLLKYGQTATITGRALSSVHQHVVRTRMVSFTSRYSAQQRQILASRQKLMAIASRLISREMPRLPLDAESLSAMVTKDVTVFTYSNKKYFLLLTIFGGFQFLCWLNVALFINLVDPVAVENTGKPQKNVSSWMDRFYVEHRTKMAAACFGLGKRTCNKLLSFSVVKCMLCLWILLKLMLSAAFILLSPALHSVECRPFKNKKGFTIIYVCSLFSFNCTVADSTNFVVGVISLEMMWYCVRAGCFVLLYSLGYPLRTVSRLTLLKGGNQLSVTTYSHFGRTRHFTVPLDDVSCKKSRMSSPAHASMKIRGRWLYFLLDTRDGRFHEPELFDYVIGLSRSFK